MLHHRRCLSWRHSWLSVLGDPGNNRVQEAQAVWIAACARAEPNSSLNEMTPRSSSAHAGRVRASSLTGCAEGRRHDGARQLQRHPPQRPAVRQLRPSHRQRRRHRRLQARQLRDCGYQGLVSGAGRSQHLSAQDLGLHVDH